MLAASQSKAKVLVVEDDALARELLAQVLQTAGFDVVATSFGEQALLILCQQGDRIDWLVSKASLPGLVCGWILKDEYNEHHPDRPVLLISPLNRTDASRANAIFVPPAAPIKTLEVLQSLAHPEPFPVLGREGDDSKIIDLGVIGIRGPKPLEEIEGPPAIGYKRLG